MGGLETRSRASRDYLLALNLALIFATSFDGSLLNSDGSASVGTKVVMRVVFYLFCAYLESKWVATPGKMILG